MKLLYTPAAKKIGPVEPEIMGRPPRAKAAPLQDVYYQ